MLITHVTNIPEPNDIVLGHGNCDNGLYIIT